MKVSYSRTFRPLSKALEERVMEEFTVDTRKFRYRVHEFYGPVGYEVEIQRLPLELLDTDMAHRGWETVKKSLYSYDHGDLH